jgi:hypothetical protein
MRKLFVGFDDLLGDAPNPIHTDYLAHKVIDSYAPWARYVAPVRGGYWAFESLTEAQEWERLRRELTRQRADQDGLSAIRAILEDMQKRHRIS